METVAFHKEGVEDLFLSEIMTSIAPKVLVTSISDGYLFYL